MQAETAICPSCPACLPEEAAGVGESVGDGGAGDGVGLGVGVWLWVGVGVALFVGLDVGVGLLVGLSTGDGDGVGDAVLPAAHEVPTKSMGSLPGSPAKPQELVCGRV